MREEGIVKRELDGLCEVVVRRKTACGDNCASCGADCKMKFQQVTAKNQIGAKAGDSVIIEMDSKRVLLSAFLVYILPVLVFFISFFTVQKIYASSTLAPLVSAILTVAVFGVTVLFDRKHKSDFLPSVIKICENT